VRSLSDVVRAHLGMSSVDSKKAAADPKPAVAIDPAALAEARRLLKAEARAKRVARELEAAARQARADEKRRVAHAVRAARCEATIKHVCSQMTSAELGRWGKLIDTIRRQALKRNTTSHDLKIDLGMVLPPEILTRVGLKADQDNVTWPVKGAKDYIRNRTAEDVARDRAERRIEHCDLVADDQPSDLDFATAIINSGKKTRNESPIDKSDMINPGDRRIKKS
jgi:hypothetical protein